MLWAFEHLLLYEPGSGNSLGFPGGSVVKNLPAMQETQLGSLGWEDALDKGMETHSSILAWRIPGTEEPGRLQSMGPDTTEMTQQQQQGMVYSKKCFFQPSFLVRNLLTHSIIVRQPCENKVYIQNSISRRARYPSSPGVSTGDPCFPFACCPSLVRVLFP